MEGETIDLTDPLEDLLRETGWTPEYLQERLVRLSEDNAKKVCGSTKHLRDMTLSDLLGDYKCSNSRSSNDVITESIELSDDEVTEVTDLENQEDPETQEVIEVRVIETNDDAYDTECNEDDDDEFLEESATDRLHSNKRNACDIFSVLEKESVDNINESFSNCLDDKESSKHISSNLNDIDCIERNDLPVKITKEKNVKEICISTDINTSTSSLVNSSNHNRAITATTEHNEIELSTEPEKACINEDRQENRGNFDDLKENLIEKEIQNISNNTHKNENVVDPTFTKGITKFLSCDSETPSSSVSYKSTFSQLDESFYSNISESDDNISSDLGFIVSGVRGGIDFIESSEKLTNIEHEKPDSNNEDKNENNITNEFDSLVSKPSSKSSHLDNSNILSNQGSDNLHHSKLIQDTIDEKQLDIACQEDSSPNSNCKEVTTDNNGDTLANTLSFFAKNETTQFFGDTVEATNSATSLLLKSLDEAINTICDKNYQLRENFAQEHAEIGKNEFDSSQDSFTNIGDVNREHQTDKNQKKAVLDPLKDDQNLLKSNLDLSLKENCSAIIAKNNECSTIANITSYNESATNDLSNTTMHNKTEINNESINSAYTSEHSSEIWANSNSFAKTNTMTEELKEIQIKETFSSLNSASQGLQVHCENQNDLDKVKDQQVFVNASNNKQDLQKNCYPPITKDSNNVNDDNKKFLTKSTNCMLKNDTALYNADEIKNSRQPIFDIDKKVESKSDKCETSIDSLVFIVSNISVNNDINNKNINLDKDFNNLTRKEETDKIIDYQRNNTTKPEEAHATVNEVMENETLENNTYNKDQHLDLSHKEIASHDDNDGNSIVNSCITLNEETDKIIDCQLRNNTTKPVELHATVDDVVETKTLENNTCYNKNKHLDLSHKEIASNDDNDDNSIVNSCMTLNEETDKIIDCQFRNNTTKPEELHATLDEVMKIETSENIKYNTNKHLDLSHKEIASNNDNDGNSIVNSCIPNNITECSSKNFVPNVNTTTCLLRPQEKLLEKETKLNNNNNNAPNILESEKVIPDICVTSVYGNLIATEDSNIQISIKEDSEEDNSAEENSQEKFEEIRKNLKLQLTSLRTGKRMDILQNVKTKVTNIDFHKKFDNLSQDSNSIKSFEDISANNGPIKKLKEVEEFLHPVKHHSVSHLTKTVEAGYVINKLEDVHVSNVPLKQDAANLTARVASAAQSESTIETQDVSNVPINQDSTPLISNSAATAQSESAVEMQEDEDIPNVLSEIRKIIRKQKAASKTVLLKSTRNTEDTDVKSVDHDSQKNNIIKCQEKEEINAGDANSTIDKSQDQTLISTNLADKNTSTVINSPFVSNTLDEFLNDAKLNVSYTIPKSGAEEGLRQNYSDEPIMPLIVAEIKDEDNEKTTQQIKYKPKTLAEKRRLLEKSKQKEKKRLEKLKKVEETQNRSYVLFKDKKIFLRAKSMGKCIASIESSIPINECSQPTTPKKPSLLTELYKKVSTPVKYRPGPLCKKHLLQSDYSNWSSELQTLPTVILKIMPQLGKPIHPNLIHILPQWDGEVTDDQIDFALSALNTKGEKKQNKIFKFNVSYQNQQTQILTRKKILDKEIIQFENLARTKKHSSTEEDVAEVIEKLLNYVDIKEIAPTLLKYDQDVTTPDKDPLETEVAPLDNHVLVKRKSRFSKTDRELIRLNCKVVSVEVEDNEPERQCFKLYCKLGCVCKSLKCEKIIGLHCKKVNCIFGCTCPKEKDKIVNIAEPTIRLPAGTDLLSTDTVNRIEGEAKRNLAKVEKEFTQTIILTNNKTIVVGFGNKPRRATKTPKKYIDFDDEKSMDDIKEPKKESIVPIRECSIILKNWDFSDLVPYCLVHHLYNCHCRGRSTFSPKISVENYKNETVELLKLKKDEKLVNPIEKVANISLDRHYSKKEYPAQTVEESFQAIIRQSAILKKNLNIENDFEETLYSVTGRPLRKRKKIYEADFVFDVDNPSSVQKITDQPLSDKFKTTFVDESTDCSRTSKISDKYYRKKRSFTNAALYYDFANNLTQADLLKALQQENENNISDCDLLKRTIIEERRKLLGDTETEIHKKKRKQKIQVRRDENITIRTTEVPIPKQAHQVKAKSVFKGEIIVNDSEWLKKLGHNAKQSLDGYARILPWSALLNGFLSKSINVYCISDMPLKLLLNVGSKLSCEKILDVEIFGHKILEAPLRGKASWLLSQSENVREIIKWLLSGTLPSRYKTTCLSFLLVETLPGQFEVRGLCTQGENKADVQENQTELLNEGELSDQVTEVKHKNMKNETQSLFITKGKFRLRELVEDGCDDDHTDNLYMWVGLPEVYKVAKWRVVFLNNDFAYLYFKNIQYSIKYTDLAKLTEMAKNDALTLVLKNLQIRRGYDHASFGIYISHHYLDRIFIGPYFINYDEDEVETLRYINQQLVSSECFNKMTGNSNYRCGHWMFERTYRHPTKNGLKDTIDLTNEDSPVKPAKKLSVKNVPQQISVTTPQMISNLTKDEHIIYHNGMPINIKNSKPRSPSEFNRFIITNIPHFGYLGAYQPDNSSVLEVSWPFEKKVLQFENADNARDFLQERFNQLLQPVPETFKIQVIVLIQLDLKEHEPINSDFLSGHCICGYFGTYNFRTLTDAFCKENFNISKEEITKLFAKRAHAYIRKKIDELAELVEINKHDPMNFNVPTILEKAKKEIKLQETNRRTLISDIQAYELEVIAKMKKLYEIVNTLPTKEKTIESKIINEVLKIRPKRLGANEVVEINDDDDSSPPTNPNPDIIYDVDSNDVSFPEQPKKKPLKRKRATRKKGPKPKVVKIAPSTDRSVGPSISVSVEKEQTNNDLKPSIVKNVITNNSKHRIVIVRAHQPVIQPPLEAKDREIITIDEDTETIIINDDIETFALNEDRESFAINEDREKFTINEDKEMFTINEDRDTFTIDEDIATKTINDDIATLTLNKNIEMVTINDDMETETINELSEYQFEESKNLVDDDDDDNVNHYVIEYEGSDPDFTEIIVSQPDTTENMDLSRATIIASVPPTSNTSCTNSITVSRVSPDLQSSELLSNILPSKTYSNNSKPSTTTSICSTLDSPNVDTIEKNSLTVRNSKELTGKIKLGLQKILKRAEENLLFRNEND